MGNFPLDTMNAIVSITISFVALIVSVIALVYTVRTYLLKSGSYIRGSYSISSSIFCDDKYLSNITLENLKDRAIIIFKIYLKLGHNYFIEIDDFKSSPLILKPFEAFNKDYDPIDLYSAGTEKILINDLLGNKYVRKQIVLSTSEGKYIVKENINYWDPVFDYFQNYMTEVIHPRRSTYKGKSYGSRVKFIVDLTTKDGNQVIPIYTRDYERKIFRNFDLPKSTFASKETLEHYLVLKIDEGKLNCTDLVVIEMGSWLNEIYQDENKRVITASYHNWFTYHVIGRIASLINNLRIKRANKLSQSKKEVKTPQSVKTKRKKPSSQTRSIKRGTRKR